MSLSLPLALGDPNLSLEIEVFSYYQKSVFKQAWRQWKFTFLGLYSQGLAPSSLSTEVASCPPQLPSKGMFKRPSVTEILRDLFI